MPTVTIGDNTGGSANTFTGTDDARLHQQTPTTNEGGTGAIEASRFSGGDHNTGLIRFSGLSNITGPVTVTSARIRLWQFLNSGTNTVSAYECSRAWVEAECTWNNYSTGNAWNTAGALGAGTDYVNSVLDTITTATVSDESYLDFDSAAIAALVQDWINGVKTNNGIVFLRTDGQNDATFHSFQSSEGNNGERPILEVTYTEGSGSTTVVVPSAGSQRNRRHSGRY